MSMKSKCNPIVFQKVALLSAMNSKTGLISLIQFSKIAFPLCLNTALKKVIFSLLSNIILKHPSESDGAVIGKVSEPGDQIYIIGIFRWLSLLTAISVQIMRSVYHT